MRKSKLFLLILFLGLVASHISCEVQSDDKELCEQTKWNEVKEVIITVGISQPLDHCDDNTHRADTAEFIRIKGSIQKVYCDNTPSGKFNFDNLVQPDPNVDYINVGQRYQFKFENDKDRLVVKCILKAYFADGNIYESEEAQKIFYYNDIKFDFNTLEYYILFDLPKLSWHRSL
ncbi:MAG: hypothetical protein R3250_05895 [Melioribacteraceae bacterium]|nr:hypothetical protein [Melioribacteraceae bacterium]